MATKSKLTLDEALQLLKSTPKARKGAKAEKIGALAEKLPCPIPGAWQKLMLTVDGGIFQTSMPGCEEDGLELSNAKEFVENNEYAREFIQIGWPDFPEHYLAIAANDYQDFFFLDTSKTNSAGDCPVVLIDHEECRVTKRWQNVAAFLSDFLSQKPKD